MMAFFTTHSPFTWLASAPTRNVRGRARQAHHGMLEEPLPLFLGKNFLLTAAIVYLSYLLASYRGMPNVLIVMALLIEEAYNEQLKSNFADLANIATSTRRNRLRLIQSALARYTSCARSLRK